MKRVLCVVLILLSLLSLHGAMAEAPSGPEKALTVMIYMCGSNLESQYGSACADIEEIRNSGVNLDAVNVLLLTGGSAYWHTGQDAASVEIHALKYNKRSGDNRWKIENTLPRRSMGDKRTLTDFIDWGVQSYPAGKYALILWDHGAGPLEGICLDELNAPDRLSIGELAEALAEASLPGKLSWIGMDACLMATAEVAKAVSPYAEYMIASQETEPADGWDYGFLSGVEADGDGAATGRRIVNAYFDSQGAETMGLTLSCLDLSRIEAVAEAMNSFFEPIGRAMNKDTFARLSTLRTQSASFGKVVRGLTAAGYDLVDLGDLISHFSAMGGDNRLEMALEDAVIYRRPDDESVSGLSVYHPLRNKAGYQQAWKQQYSALDFSAGYQKYLNSFGALLMGRELADWSQISLSDDGFNAAGENRYSLRLTPLQRENIASAQLIVLGAIQVGSGDEAVYNAQLSELGASTGDACYYYPVLIDEVQPDADGVLSATYTGRSLYITDESGRAVAGPIGYQRSDDGAYWYIRATYYDWSGREDASDYARVLYTCVLDEATGALNVVNTEVYDALTETYTRRIAFDEADYTEMYVDRLARAVPEGDGALPAFADWKSINSDIEIALPLKWRLRFFDEQMSGTQLFATMQITDVQQNSYCTPPVRVENPNLYAIDMQPRQITGNGFELTLYAIQDSSPLNPGLNIGASFKNTSHQVMTCDLGSFELNGHRSVTNLMYLTMYNVGPGDTVSSSGHLDLTELAGLDGLTELSFEMTVRLAGSTSDYVSRDVHSVRLSGCDASVTGGAAFVPLGEVVRGDETWQLLDLHRNARGGLSGTLRVVNDSDRAIYGYNYMVVNDRLQIDEPLYFSVDAHRDVCVPFEIENSVYGHDLVVSGAPGNRFRYMGFDHLMERFGIAQITSLKLCRADGESPFADSIAFEWAEPVPAADPGEIARYQTPGEAESLLPDGDFAVSVDRLLAADDGIALRLLITNRSDRDLKFMVKYPTLNGETAYLSDQDEEYAVGAGATLIANVGIKESDNKAVSEIGLCFRYGDFTTHSAKIALDAPVTIGADAGVYVSGSDLRVFPVDNARPRIGDVRIAPVSTADPSDAALCLTAGLSNDEGIYRLENVEGSAVLTLTLSAENKSADELEIAFGDIVINGTRYAGGSANIRKLAPGGTDSCSVQIKGVELANLAQVSAIGCRATVQRSGDRDDAREYPLAFEVSGIPLTGAVPGLTQPLGEAKAGGVTLGLMSLQEDERGRLEGVLHLDNGSDAPLEDKYADLFINGVTGSSVNAALPAGTDRYIPFTFGNALDVRYLSGDFEGKSVPDMSRLLQRMGMDAVRSVSLQLDESGADGLMAVALDAPLPLTPWSAVDMAAPKPLLEGDAFVGATHAAMTGKGLFLTLTLRNDSDAPQSLTIIAADADGRAMEVNVLNTDFRLAPGATRVVNALFATDGSMLPGDRLEEVSLSFIAGGELFEGATLRLNAPMTVGSAELRGVEAFTTAPAGAGRLMPAALESVGAPGAGCVYAAELTAPVTGRDVERFDHGYAVICLRGEGYVKEASGEYVKHPTLRELCRIPLAREDGRLIAPYSGLVMWNGSDTVLTRQTPLANGETELRAQIVLYSKDQPVDSELSGPLSGRGYGVLMDGCWTVAGAGNGPAVREGGWTLRDLATGELCAMPSAQDGWSMYGDQVVHYEDGYPDKMDADYYVMPKRLTLIPVQTLDAELAVRYEICYTGGDSQTVTVGDALEVIRQSALARAERSGILGEAEPDGAGSIPVVPGVFEAGQARVSVSARLKLEDAAGASYEDPQPPQVRLGLCMKIENRADFMIDAVSTNLVLNGGHETGTQWTALRIGAGSACVDIWYIEPEDLRAVGGVHRIQCTLNLYRSGKSDEVVESIPIDVALEEMDEAALLERCEAAGETDVFGVTWQLLSAEIDEYGRVRGKLRATNHTNTAWDFTDNAVLANGYRATSVLSDFKLEAQSSQEVFYAFENFVWVDIQDGEDGEETREVPQTLFVLQSHGVKEVTELTFLFGMNYDIHRECVRPRQTMTFALPEPLSVPSKDFDDRPKKLLMREDGLSVWLESVMLCGDSLSLALEVSNDTDDMRTLDLDHLNLDGRDIYSWNWIEYSMSTVLPHTTQSGSILAWLYDPDACAANGIGDIHICFCTRGDDGQSRVYRAAHVWPGAPLKQAGDLIRVGDLEVRQATYAAEPAPGLTDELCLPPDAAVRPRALTPPIDAGKAAMFESGEASVCIRQGRDEYDYPELTCQTLSREIVSLALERDAGGTVSAQYSGTALTFWGMPFPMREQTRGGETDISATIYLFRDFYDAFEIRDPGMDGGSPDVVPVGAPSYVAYEQEGVVPQVKVGLHYRVDRTEGEPARRDQETAFIDMRTGDALDGSVTDWMYSTMAIFNVFFDDDYVDAHRLCRPISSDTSCFASLQPIEVFTKRYWDDAELVVRYRLRYSDGTEETLVEPY